MNREQIVQIVKKEAYNDEMNKIAASLYDKLKDRFPYSLNEAEKEHAKTLIRKEEEDNPILKSKFRSFFHPEMKEKALNNVIGLMYRDFNHFNDSRLKKEQDAKDQKALEHQRALELANANKGVNMVKAIGGSVSGIANILKPKTASEQTLKLKSFGNFKVAEETAAETNPPQDSSSIKDKLNNAWNATKEAGLLSNIGDAFTGRNIREGNSLINYYDQAIKDLNEDEPIKTMDFYAKMRDYGKELKNKGIKSTALAYGGTAAAGLGTYLLMKKINQRKQMAQDQDSEMPVEGEAKEAGLLSNIGDAFTGRNIREGFKEHRNTAKEISKVDGNSDNSITYASSKKNDDGSTNMLSKDEYKKGLDAKQRDNKIQMAKGVGQTALAYGGTAAAGLGTYMLMKKLKQRKQMNEAQEDGSREEV